MTYLKHISHHQTASNRGAQNAYACCITLLLAGLLTFAAPMRQAHAGVQFGMGDAYNFVNVIQNTGGWLSTGTSTVVEDSNGWPTSDFYITMTDQRQNMPWNGPNPAAVQEVVQGTYALSFTGLATVANNNSDASLSVQNQVYNSGSNTTTANIVVPNGYWLLQLKFTSTQRTSTSATNTGITNVVLISPGYSPTSPPIFTTNCISDYTNAAFSCVRTLGGSGCTTYSDWDGTNYIHGIDWSDRVLPTDPHFNGLQVRNASSEHQAQGIPWEFEIALANTSNADLWVNVPEQATNNYITQLATLIKNGDTVGGVFYPGLNSNHHVYVEMSDELWNFGGPSYFQAAGWNQTKAQADGISNIEEDVKTTILVSNIFASVWGSGAINNSVRPVVEWQYQNEANMQTALQWAEGQYGKVNQFLFGIGQAAYTDTQDYSSVANIIGTAYTQGDSYRRDYAGWTGVSQYYGLHFTAYEAGLSFAPDMAVYADTALQNSGVTALIEHFLLSNFFATGGYLVNNLGMDGYQWNVIAPTTNFSDPRYQAAKSVLATSSVTQTAGYVLPWSSGSTTFDAGQDITLDWKPGQTPATSNTNLLYLLRVPASANYTVTLNGSSGGSSVTGSIDDSSIGNVTLPSGGGSQSFSAVTLSAGYHTLMLAISAGGNTSFTPSAGITVTFNSGGGSGIVPSAPDDLVPTVGASQVALLWDIQSMATSYNVKRSTVSGGPFTNIATGLSSNSYTDTSAVNGTLYYYVVSAVNSIGEGAYSAQNACMPTPASAPSAPGGLTVTTDGNQSTPFFNGGGNVELTWNAVGDATSYNIYQNGSKVASADSPFYCVASLTLGTQYTYAVTAVNRIGESGQSSSVNGTPQELAPAVPTSLISAVNGSSVSLSWGTELLLGEAFSPYPYNVYRSTTNGGPYSLVYQIAPANFVDGPLSNGTYYYVVAQCNSVGTSGYSNQVTAVVSGGSSAPPAPTLSATAGNAQVALSWTTSTGATSYNVYRGTTSGGESGTPIASGVTTTAYTNTGLTNGTTYYYKVNAANSSGTSALSNEVLATPTAPPSAPSGLSASAGNAQVSLTWNSSSGAASYDVYDGTVSGGESGTPVTTGISSTSDTVTGLTNGTTYYFKITAVNAGGTSGYSNEASAKPQVSAPPAPTGLTASPGNAQVSLSWNASSGATSYNVYRGTASGGESATAIATGVTTVSYTDTAVTNGTTYYYTVKALNAGGTSAASNEASATPAASTGVLMCSEPFSEATGAISGANGGTGWAAAWVEQNNHTNVPGYNIINTSPLTYTGLSTSGNYAVGGYAYETCGRNLDVSSGGNFGSNGYISSGLIGVSGKSLWMSMLMREDTSSADDIYITLGPQSIPWAPSPALVSIGYFGTASQTGGTRYWSLEIGSTVYQTTVPITVGTTTLLVAEITFGSTCAVNLYVNPTSLGGSAPSSSTLTETTSTNLAFQSLCWYGGSGPGMSSFDQIDFGTTYGSVTPSTSSAPPTPTGLTATPGNAQVALSWNSSTGATSYNVLRSTVSGSGYVQVVNVGTTTYTNTGLTNGTTYYFVVAAVNSGGTSANSSQVSATPVAPPAAPTGLTASPGNAQVALNWSSSTGATGYNVLRSTTSGSGYAQVTGVGTTSYTNTGLTNGTTYYYVVAAVNAGGTSANSSQVSAVPSAAPPAPTGLAATPGNAQVALAWNSSSGATSYDVYRGTTSGGESATPIATGITSTAYTNTGLTNGTTYYYKVTAVNAGGTSGYSNEVSATPQASGVLLAQEEFTESTGVLNGAGAAGSGWAGAWSVQNNDTTVPGYNIVNTTPLTYTGLATAGNYAVGGNAYLSSGRSLDVTSTGTFNNNGYVSSGLIGASGKTLWFSVLLRKDASTEDENAFVMQATNNPWFTNSPLVSAGYFGSPSDTGGTRYWSLEIGTTVYQTTVPVTVGTPALLVMSIAFGSTNTVNLYVNPTSLGGSPPSPTLTETTTTSVAFQSMSYSAGNGPGASSADEIRFGTTYGIVTP